MRARKRVTDIHLEFDHGGELNIYVTKNGRKIFAVLNAADGASLMRQAEVFYKAALLANSLDAAWCRKAAAIGVELG
jgi:hypothetical protein